MCAADLYVRVLRAGGAPLSGTALFLPMGVELGFSEDSHTGALILQSYSCAAVQLLLDLSAHRQHDGNGHVDGPA